jgi:hypothetical protein
MESISLILGALVVGTAETTKQAVQDAYEGLKRLLAVKFDERPDAQAALAGQTIDAGAEPLLAEAITATGADTDEEILAAARAVLGSSAGTGSAATYVVHMPNSRAVQNGNANFMSVRFGGESSD